MTILPTDALIIVDAQKDFCAGGALAVPDADSIIPVINKLLPRFDQVIYTRDWHPPKHCSFADDPAYRDGSWPPHCVAESPGAEFHAELNIAEDATIVSKATTQETESYSGFQGTQLAETLRQRDLRRVFVCGLATDFCVKATVLDALREGFSTVLIEDACRAVDNPPTSGPAAIEEMTGAGAVCLQSTEITL